MSTVTGKPSGRNIVWSYVLFGWVMAGFFAASCSFLAMGGLTGCAAEGRINPAGASGTIELPPPRFSMDYKFVPCGAVDKQVVVLVDHKHNREYLRETGVDYWIYLGPATNPTSLYTEIPAPTPPAITLPK